ncbi:LysR family transcriptional regulator [Escherichia coli O66:H5]|uniref:LysR family transcriptional regulator n=1 Tax=Escherichia coli TaxID=562 RepID=UPI000D174D53|nr:LysR family transcriptional regulator [Escherichia coli]ELU4644626.1 LysR family transcriptional regulator [Escherichia coli]MDZ7199218.1 LysR family transcriptional regulator [Escherichia coli]PSZ34177.1 LysR family transcriptional regulator [Escherichia coli]HAI4589431.1 LysR family transcriptional regulator [Escherichia coli]HCT4273681.1 LysR family transcriptional regulator [Escherichia coli]
MDLKRLRYFCRVVEQGSVSRAAKVLNMAQPPLSKRIQELEDELKAPLFIRKGNRIEPTEAGFFLYRKACEILRQVEDTTRETMAIAQKNNPKLHLGITHLFQSYFRSLLLAFCERNPDIEVSISVTDSSHLEDLLNDGTIDLALIQRPYRDEGYDVVSFDPIKPVAVISKKCLPYIPDTPVNYITLASFPLILLHRAKDSGIYEKLLDLFRKTGVTPEVLMHISQPGMIIDWLESGLAAATLLPSSEVDATCLRHCHVVDIFPSPQLFYPAMVKMPATNWIPEVMEIIAAGYPCNMNTVIPYVKEREVSLTRDK